MVIDAQGRANKCAEVGRYGWVIGLPDSIQISSVCFLQIPPRRQRSKVLPVHTSPRTGGVACLLLGSWAWLISKDLEYLFPYVPMLLLVHLDFRYLGRKYNLIQLPKCCSPSEGFSYLRDPWWKQYYWCGKVAGTIISISLNLLNLLSHW